MLVIDSLESRNHGSCELNLMALAPPFNLLTKNRNVLKTL